MSASFSCKEYAPFVPEVLGNFEMKPKNCNVSAYRDKDGVLQLSYTINWSADDASAAIAGLSFKDKAKSRSSRSQQRQRRSRTSSTRSRGSNSRQRKCRAIPSPRRSRKSSRRSDVSCHTSERSFLGIPSPRANLLQMMEVTLVMIDRKGNGIEQKEVKKEMVSNEKLYNCINDMLANLGTTLSSLSHQCPVRLFYRRMKRLRPISYEDFHKMHLNHFNALDGTLTFVLDLANSVHL